MGKQEREAARKPYVVMRDEIPMSSGVGNAPQGSRQFLAHELLAQAVASTSARLAWLELAHDQALEPRRHPEPGLLVVLRGRARLVGSKRRSVEQGDVIILRPEQEYGLTSVDADGLEALHVIFSDEHMSNLHLEVTLEEVLAHNEARLQAWLATPYFRMLRDGTLDSAPARRRFKQCIRVFSDFFQAFLVTRQAMCRDDSYGAAFNSHLAEEFGHNTLLQVPDDPRVYTDPSLQATLSWFCHQMMVLDNAGKAAINLVLESGGYHFHNVAKPAFKGDDVEVYFQTHAEDDEQHKDLCLNLLEGQHPVTYLALRSTLDSAWDMLGATTQRIFELVESERLAS